MGSYKTLTAILCVLLWAIPGSAVAADAFWTGASATSDLWTDSGNWADDAVPGSADDAYIDGGPLPREPLVDVSVDATHSKITIGKTSATTPVTVTITGGKLTSQSFLRLGNQETAKGIILMSGGILDIGNHWDIGLNGDADVVMSGNAFADVALNVFMPRGGAGQAKSHTSYLEMNDNATINANGLVMRRAEQPAFTIFSSININDNAKIVLTDPGTAPTKRQLTSISPRAGFTQVWAMPIRSQQDGTVL